MANKMNSTKVVTGVVRLSYANVWEPASINGSNPKYSAVSYTHLTLPTIA